MTTTTVEVNGETINLDAGNPQLIAICQKLLQDAQTGRLRGIAFVAATGTAFTHGHVLPNEPAVLAITRDELDGLKDELRSISRQHQRRPGAIIPARFGG